MWSYWFDRPTQRTLPLTDEQRADRDRKAAHAGRSRAKAKAGRRAARKARGR